MAGAVPHRIRRGEGECRIKREGRVVEAIFQEDLPVGLRTAVLPSVGGRSFPDNLSLAWLFSVYPEFK